MTPIVALYAQAAPNVPDEVSVRGKRREVGETKLAASDAREMPGAFGDTFRAVEALPGVTSVLSGIPYFFIRGAPPNNSGYFLDGVRTPQLFHVGVGHGVIHPGIVERVDFFPGAAPARFGGFAGGTVSGELKAPSHELHGEANVRAFDAGALVEAPFAGDRGTALVAARYGYPGPVLRLFTNDIRLDYWDYQTRTTYAVSDRDTLGVFAFGNHDRFARRKGGVSPEEASKLQPLVEDFVSDVHRVDLRWDRTLDAGHMRVAATIGYDRTGSEPTFLRDRSAGVRLEIERRLSRDVRFRGGARLGIDDYEIDTEGSVEREKPMTLYTARPRTNVTTAVHGDVVWRLAPRVELVPGVRVDTFSDVPAFDPRLAARVMLSDRVAWLSTAGLSHQYASLRVGVRDLPFQIATQPGFVPGSKKLQEVAQASQGVEVRLPADVVLTTTAFLSGWTSLTDLTVHCEDKPSGIGRDAPVIYDCPSNEPVHGRAYGLEVLARRSLSKRLSGWLSATISRSVRETRVLRSDGGENVATVPSEGDRLLVLNAIAAYDLGRRWRAGGRFVFYTGTPYSKSDGDYMLPPYNNQRLPPFFRVDVRLEKRWSLGAHGSIAFVAEVQNLTLSKESFGMDCAGRMEGGAPGAPPVAVSTTCKLDAFGPITLPSIGVEAFF